MNEQVAMIGLLSLCTMIVGMALMHVPGIERVGVGVLSVAILPFVMAVLMT